MSVRTVCRGTETSEHLAAQAAACVKHSCLNYADAELQEIIDESNWRYNQAFEEAQRQHQQPVSSLPFVQSTGTGYSSEVSAPSRGLSLCVGLHVVQRHIRSTALKLFSASFFLHRYSLVTFLRTSTSV